MEGERKEEKGRGRDGRPGAGPPKIFGLEPPLIEFLKDPSSDLFFSSLCQPTLI
jgi:hypothetical protein